MTDKNEAIIKAFLLDWQNQLRWRINETVITIGLHLERKLNLDAENLYTQPFGYLLRRIAAAAEGEIPQTPENQDEIYKAGETLHKLLFDVPGMPAMDAPAEWWMTPMGNLALRAYYWATGDELITVTQASQITGYSLSYLSQLISRRKLTGYPDPNEPNPTRRTRLSRREVEALTNPEE